MNSLSDLNNFGTTPFDYLDERPSQVIFDRQYPLTALDQQLFINTTTITPAPGIDIEEIINYQTANVRYRVTLRTGTITPIVGSSITWNSLPSGVTLTQAGNEYTISGLHSVADWNGVKNFNWILPANYASFPLWYLDVEIIYFDSALNQDVSMAWLVYDDRFFYVSELQGSAEITALVGANYGGIVSLNAKATISADCYNRIQFSSSMTANATMAAQGVLTSVGILNARATMSVTVGVRSPATASLTGRALINSNLLQLSSNLDIQRNVLTNNSNLIFPANTPSIDTPNPSTDTIAITLTAVDGGWGNSISSVPTNPYTITGTKDQVNAQLLTLRYFPAIGSTFQGTRTFTWQHSINGSVIYSYNIQYYQAQSAYQGEIIEIKTVGTTSWTPTWTQFNYGGKIDFLLVGGGGAGGAQLARVYPGGGGAAGQMFEQFNFSLTSGASYNVTVGAGGVGGNSDGGTGGNTVAFTKTATGGLGGKATFFVGSTATRSGDGGGPGGGSGYADPYGSGGGVGRGGIEFLDGTVNKGGNGNSGRQSSINNQYYGGGGGGSGRLTPGSGGIGGGGTGGTLTAEGSAGQANTGGGGAGGIASGSTAFGKNGGSGIIVIKAHS